MGLGISTNILADLEIQDEEGYQYYKQDFERINALLASASLPTFSEPETLIEQRERGQIGSFPYSWLHYLRRAVAYWLNDQPLMPTADDPICDRLLEEEYYRLRSHIICHSDAEGYYLPIDFSRCDLLFEPELCGNVGSSYAVLKELIGVAPLIGIELTEGELSDAQAAQLASERIRLETVPFGIERQVWFRLYEAARLSIEHQTAIVFQ